MIPTRRRRRRCRRCGGGGDNGTLPYFLQQSFLCLYPSSLSYDSLSFRQPKTVGVARTVGAAAAEGGERTPTDDDDDDEILAPTARALFGT